MRGKWDLFVKRVKNVFTGEQDRQIVEQDKEKENLLEMFTQRVGDTANRSVRTAIRTRRGKL